MRGVVLAGMLAVAACGAEDDAERATPGPTEATARQAVTLRGPGLWDVDRTASSVTFFGTQGGDRFAGRFSRFDVQVRLDPEDMSAAAIVAVVDLTSVDAGTDDRNRALPTPEWFDTARHPAATFTSETVQDVGDGRYEAVGTLALKGVDRPLTLPFALATDEDTAVAQAAFVIDRTAFGIGEGDFAGPDWVGTDVAVTIRIEARRAAPG